MASEGPDLLVTEPHCGRQRQRCGGEQFPCASQRPEPAPEVDLQAFPLEQDATPPFRVTVKAFEQDR
jgi:hypothetical protein